MPDFHVRRVLPQVDAAESPIEASHRSGSHRQLRRLRGAEKQALRSTDDLTDVAVVGPVVRASQVAYHPRLAVLIVGGFVVDFEGVAGAGPLGHQREDCFASQHEVTSGGGRSQLRSSEE